MLTAQQGTPDKSCCKVRTYTRTVSTSKSFCTNYIAIWGKWTEEVVAKS